MGLNFGIDTADTTDDDQKDNDPCGAGVHVELQEQLMRLDLAVALERVGGDTQLLREIALLFLQECPKLMESIRVAIDTGDPSALEIAAHSMKGSVGNFGARQAVTAALQLEIIGRSKKMEGAPQAWEELSAAIQSLQPELSGLSAD